MDRAPNTGRIIDVWLGGRHHTEVDAAAAAAFDELYDGFPTVFRTLRDYIGRASRFVAGQGVDRFLVLGAGIPTCGNVHEAVPSARVLYTDIDHGNVELGRRILDGEPGVGYEHADATDLGTLDQERLRAVLGDEGPLGVVYVGVAAFLDDEQLAASIAALHGWVPAGSYLVLDVDGDALRHHPAVLDVLAGAGEPLHTRTAADVVPLLGPWEVLEPGVVPVARWQPGPAAVAGVDGPTFMFGCVARKPA